MPSFDEFMQKFYNYLCDKNIEMLNVLLTKYVSPEEILSEDGATSLHIAANFKNEEDSLEILKLLLQFTTNPNFLDRQGKTCLHYFAQKGYSRCLDLLICNGGDPMQADLNGLTPIDDAYYYGSKKCALNLTSFLDSEIVEEENTAKYLLLLSKRDFIEIKPETNELNIYPEVFLSCQSSNNTSPSLKTKRISSTNKKCLKKSSDDIFETAESNLSNNSTDLIGKSLIDCERLRLSNTNSDEELNKFHSYLENCIKLMDPPPLTDPPVQKDLVLGRHDKSFCFSTTTDLMSTFSPSVRDSSNNGRFSCLPSPSHSHDANCKSSQSFFTVVEEYLYTDTENGMQLIERRCPGTTILTSSKNSVFSLNKDFEKLLHNNTNLCKLSLINSGKIDVKVFDSCTIPESIKCLSSNQLRSNLKALGFNPGPVTPTTVKILQKKYFKLRKDPLPRLGLKTKDQSSLACEYPSELKLMLRGQDIFKNSVSRNLELEMCQQFNNPVTCWRGGNSKNCFNYLLLDPRKTRNLPLRSSLSVAESLNLFEAFISAIFYIGKGTRSRPYQHLYDALSTKKKIDNEKVQVIKSIWNDDLGVVSLHVFQNTISVDAHTREAAMLNAIGLTNVTNRANGTFYGPASLWRKSDQRKLGCYLLKKSYQIFLAEGERQLRPADLPPRFWKS